MRHRPAPRPARQPDRPGLIESFNGHLEAGYSHLEKIIDITVLRREVDATRPRRNGIRLHAGIGYVTTDDEPDERGPATCKARRTDLEAAHLRILRILVYYRSNRPTTNPETR